jgi:hypothetical protein
MASHFDMRGLDVQGLEKRHAQGDQSGESEFHALSDCAKTIFDRAPHENVMTEHTTEGTACRRISGILSRCARRCGGI